MAGAIVAETVEAAEAMTDEVLKFHLQGTEYRNTGILVATSLAIIGITTDCNTEGSHAYGCRVEMF